MAQHLAKQPTSRRAPARRPVAAPAPSAGTWSMTARERTRFVTEVIGGTRAAAAALGVAPSQPSRWARGESEPAPEQARMLIDLDHVMAHAMLVWADPSVARDWLNTPNANLDGLSPAVWLRTNSSAEVVDALRTEAAGGFA